MTATKGLGTYGNGVGTVTPLDHKMAQLGLLTKTAANTIRAGLFWDGSATIVSGKANMSYDVRAFSCVLSRGATAGAVLLTNDAVLNVATTAAPGSNSRYDVVYVWQREYTIDGVDSDPVIGVVQGVAAAAPTVPSLAAFPGAIELARILVPAGVTATNSGTTITQTAPFTAAAGGVVPVRNTTERDAGSWLESQRVWDIATDIEYVYTGAAWRRGLATNLQMDTADSAPFVITQAGIGMITGAAATSISETVTFGTAFKTATFPIVTISFVGAVAGAFDPTSAGNISGITARCYGVGPTGFTAVIQRETNMSNAANYYYAWTTLGEPA